MEQYFTLIKQELDENGMPIFTIKLNEKHSVYKGHFPTVPVTPGVVIVDICRQLTEIHTDKKLSLIASKSIKFLTMIDPTKTPILDVKINSSEVDNTYEVRVLGEYQGQAFFKIQATFSHD